LTEGEQTGECLKNSDEELRRRKIINRKLGSRTEKLEYMDLALSNYDRSVFNSVKLIIPNYNLTELPN